MRAVAEDVTSEVFLSVASKMRHFGGTTEEDFRRWVFRIATNAVNAYVRQAKRRKVLLESAARSGAGGRPPTERLRRGDAGLARVVPGHFAIEAPDQAILHLRFFEQMSYDEIAAVLNVRPATVRVGLSRALEKLRRCFKLDDDP